MYHIRTRVRRGVFAALLLSASLGLSAACSDAQFTQVTSNTIGDYCEILLESLCNYAVNTCGEGTSVDQCIVEAKPACCQNACNRSARPVSSVAISGCVAAYAGTQPSTAPDGTPIEETPGIPCEQVRSGFTPDYAPGRSCRNIFEFTGE